MLTPYPQIVEYNEAVQHPATAFRDGELRQGQVKTNALGLPVVLSGGFALTYMMTTPQRRLALRCFHREIPAAEAKYAAIAEALKALRSPYFVEFDFVPDGIRIRGGFYPVLKMEWADGAPLGVWLDRYSGDRRALESLRQNFAALAAFLEQSGISHGDIQNGNVIISRAGLRLVDYDGMYVPGMPVDFGCETGHKHFQHPGRTTAHFGPQIDRFSFIAVDLSLAALIEDPSLHVRFRQGGETILFRANDFAVPEHSDVFRCLAQYPSLHDAAANFAAVCQADIGTVPTLDDFRSGRNIPAAPKVRPSQHEIRAPRPRVASYIAPYPVLPAEDFAAVSRCVGQRVELVGEVRAVWAGSGARGRRNDQPCTVISFAPPRHDGVAITVWVDELSGATIADETWVGRWVSVSGLIDPPRIERHFWRDATHVGVSTANARDIDLISEKEARFRLCRGEKPADPGVLHTAEAKPAQAAGNRRLVGSLLRNSNTAVPAAPAAARSGPTVVPAWRPNRSNQAIVGTLRRAAAAPSPPPKPPQPRQPSPTFVPPRPAAHVTRPAAAAPAPPRTTLPKTGSFVIHPRNRVARPPSPAPPTEPSVWQRVMRFFGIAA